MGHAPVEQSLSEREPADWTTVERSGKTVSSQDPSDTFFPGDEETPRALPNFRAMLLKTVLLLGGIIGMLLAGNWLLKKLVGGRVDIASSQGTIRLVSRTYLSPKTCLWLVEVNSQQFAIIDSPNGVALQPLSALGKEEQKNRVET